MSIPGYLGDGMVWVKALQSLYNRMTMLDWVLVAAGIVCAAVFFWPEKKQVAPPPVEDDHPEDENLERMRRSLKKTAQWIIKVQPKDHSVLRESIVFSVNLEEVYGFLKSAFVRSYHQDARNYVKARPENQAETLASFLERLSKTITVEDLAPNLDIPNPPGHQ